MLSKTSYFNATLFRKNLTRFWPLWGMATFFGAIFPLAFLVQILQNNHFLNDMLGLEMTQVYYSVVSYGVPLISLFYSILCAMCVWNYLYNAPLVITSILFAVVCVATMVVAKKGADKWKI